MEIPAEKPITYDIKKEKRFLAKKRKLEALLNLFKEEDKSLIIKKKRRESTLKEDCKILQNELKIFMKKPVVEPSFYLTALGQKSRISLKSKKIKSNIIPIFLEDVYQLLLRSVINHMSPFSINWAALEQPQNLCRTVLLIVEGLPNSVIIQNKSSLCNVIDIFNHTVEIASSNVPFPQELSTLHQITHFHIENCNTYSSMFPSKKVVKVGKPEDLKKLSKLHLLLSPIQLVMENYPLPQSVFPFSRSENYTFSKDKYAPVTPDSPMFALDCEMCRTETSSNELARIALVNEKHEVIYETLVKPKVKIIDYMTKYSGITKKMLSGVITRLKDVQDEIRSILPPDAILCGQSLNNDLHALKMIHPYVIDTSIIFNGSGIRGRKDSLKYLSMMHLNEVIQDGKNGHNPIEDALATMKLVQLKLNNSVQFGDACLSEKVTTNKETKSLLDAKTDTSDVHVNILNCETDTSNGNVDIPDKKSNLLNKTSNVPDVTASVKNTDMEDSSKDSKCVIKKLEKGFFDLMSKYNKKVCLIGSEKTLDLYGSDLGDNVQKVTKPTIKKVIKATLNNMEDFNLSISHIDFNLSDKSNLISELNDTVKQIFDCCSNRTMFMVLTSDIDASNFEDIRHGIFMATVKNVS